MQFGEETTPIRKGIISKSGGCDEEIIVWAGDGLCFAGGVRSRAGQGTLFTMRLPIRLAGSQIIHSCYTALGHKLRFFRRWKPQFVTVGII